MSGFQIQLAKVQAPPLRGDVLSRERLNGWLDAKARHRVTLVLAEAGYGKTTLLADWSRQTTRRTLWYRLDPDDRDWLTFLVHLVASGRQLDPDFGEESEELIGSLGSGGPTRRSIVSSLVRELSELSEGGATLVFDDFHAVDATDDITSIVAALIERTAPSLSFVIASRREPSIPLARLRGQGAVAELGAADLQFELDETDRLFRESYDQALDRDVVRELQQRTEGWAASLQLVHAAILDRPRAEVRSFVNRLSGARGELHDFLAEEVVGRQTRDVQDFLMRVSVLASVEAEAAGVAVPSAGRDLVRLFATAERLGLLHRRGRDPDSPLRFHPLVRDFLRARLRQEIGDDALRELHLSIARHFDGRDWRIAATHFDAAGDRPSVERVIENGIDQILARGEYWLATDLLGDRGSPVIAGVLNSRLLLQRGDIDSAVAEAAHASRLARATRSDGRGTVLVNELGVLMSAARIHELTECLGRLADEPLTPDQRAIAEATSSILGAGDQGSLRELSAQLGKLLERQLLDDAPHYAGITLLNMATVATWTGDYDSGLKHTDAAEDLLSSSSGGFELTSVALGRARLLAQSGDWRSANTLIHEALETTHPVSSAEVVAEAGETLAWYGDTAQCLEIRDRLASLRVPAVWASLRLAAMLHLDVRFHDMASATRHLRELAESDVILESAVCHRFRLELARVRAHAFVGEAPDEILFSMDATSRRQESRLERSLFRLLSALISQPLLLDGVIRALDPRDHHALSVLAEELGGSCDSLSDEARDVLASEIARRRERWLPVLRAQLLGPSGGHRTAALMLDTFGEPDDIAVLRRFARSRRGAESTAGQRLIRRHAPIVRVQDLGPMRLNVGEEPVDRRAVRRKVLALICFLCTRANASASRDEVLEALWPDFASGTAANSLNQTIYFLRRTLDPDFRDHERPAYLHYEQDMVWLDPDLVTADSWVASRMIEQAARSDDDGLIEQLVVVYTDRFATDFAYEEWSTDYRDSLHSSYLQRIESYSRRRLEAREVSRAVLALEAALRVDPGADGLELLLLQAYHASGAQAALAERYAHYATVQRDHLGVEPRPLSDLTRNGRWSDT